MLIKLLNFPFRRISFLLIRLTTERRTNADRLSWCSMMIVEQWKLEKFAIKIAATARSTPAILR